MNFTKPDVLLDFLRFFFGVFLNSMDFNSIMEYVLVMFFQANPIFLNYLIIFITFTPFIINKLILLEAS